MLCFASLPRDKSNCRQKARAFLRVRISFSRRILLNQIIKRRGFVSIICMPVLVWFTAGQFNYIGSQGSAFSSTFSNIKIQPAIRIDTDRLFFSFLAFIRVAFQALSRADE